MIAVDVAVVGGGPAGVGAAVSAARAGASTMLFDEQPALGGQLRHRIAMQRTADGNRRPSAIVARLLAELDASGADVRARATVWGLFAGNVLGVAEAGGAIAVRARCVILATGSTDLPLPFAGGSLPGVMTARALQILLHVERVRPGRRFAVIGSGGIAEEIAGDIAMAGGEVVATDPGERPDRLRAEGERGVTRLYIEDRAFETDCIVLAMGRQPDIRLAQMAEAAAAFDGDLGGFTTVADAGLCASQPGLFVAGDGAGICTVAKALAEGRFAGVGAAASLGLVSADDLERERARYVDAVGARIGRRARLATAGAEAGAMARTGGSMTDSEDRLATAPCFVCRCEEITQGEIAAAVGAGAATVDDVKRRTCAGMGLCQGVYCVPAIAELVAGLGGASVETLAPFTSRPPVRLISLGQLADLAT